MSLKVTITFSAQLFQIKDNAELHSNTLLLKNVSLPLNRNIKTKCFCINDTFLN